MLTRIFYWLTQIDVGSSGPSDFEYFAVYGGGVSLVISTRGVREQSAPVAERLTFRGASLQTGECHQSS
jgi:hypothetical protein